MVNSSVFATLVGVAPPKYIAELLVGDCPAPTALAVAKSATSVHDDPSQPSVSATLAVVVSPPKIKPAVTSPADPTTPYLPVFTSAISVQLEPSHCSTLVGYAGGDAPVATIEEVCDPN